MLIFVILSITDAYLISKLSHPCYHYHSRGAITVLCSPILFPYPLSYHQLSSSLPSPLCPLRSRFLLSRLCRPCPIIYPSSSLYPPPISSSISGPLRPLQSPSPPSATPPQYYDDTKSISSTYPMPTSYLTGIHESNQDDYMGQLTDNTYHNDYIEVVNKSTTNTIYHTYPTVILNKKNSKPTESILSSDQEFIHSSDKYLPRINHKNASTSSYMPTIGDNRFVDGNVKKYLIKTNCSITMLPQNDCCTKCSIPCRFRYGQIKISLNNDQFQEVDPICNNESMKQIIIEVDHFLIARA
ncbi:Serine/threonine-protein kinase Haspin [Dirofilaria immitis]